MTDFDQMKTPPSYTSLESYGSWLFNHIAQNTDHLTCQPSEFRGRSWTDFLDDPRLCPIYNYHICKLIGSYNSFRKYVTYFSIKDADIHGAAVLKIIVGDLVCDTVSTLIGPCNNKCKNEHKKEWQN